MPALPKLRFLTLGRIGQNVGTGRTELLSSAATDRCLDVLARAGTLRRLELAGVDVTDQGLAAIARMSGLEELNLDRTKVTDAGSAGMSPRTRRCGCST